MIFGLRIQSIKLLLMQSPPLPCEQVLMHYKNLLPSTSTLKKKVADSSESFAPIYKTTRHHFVEDCDMNRK
jgi:hypothetical protein